MNPIHIVIPGEPIAWARAGAFVRGRKPVFYDKQKDYKWYMQQYMSHALTNYFDGDSKKGQAHFLSGGYDAVMRCYFSPPQSLSKRDKNLLSWGLLHYTKKPDGDNLFKLGGDSGNGVLYKDDAQIVSLYVKKFFCNDGKPRTEIWIMPKKPITAEKVLAEVNLDEVVDFCESSRVLGNLLDKYRHTIKTEYDPDELYASSIAYHLTKIVDEHSDLLKKLDKHKKLWQNINAECPLPGEGKNQ